MKGNGGIMSIWSKRMNLINIIVGIFITVIFMLGFITESLYSGQSTRGVGTVSTEQYLPSNIQPLIFSHSKHSYERNLVREHEHISSAKFKTGKIYLALVDLNDDGIKEIVSYLDIFNYCGQETGCPLNIYIIANGKLTSLLMHDHPIFNHGFPMFIEIDKTGKQSVIGILSSTTMGWKDILIKGETIWKWHGNYYAR
jgi:hypothetical protein